MIKSFLVDDIAQFDIGNAPQDLKDRYTNVLQIVNAYGPEGSDTTTTGTDTGTAAPA